MSISEPNIDKPSNNPQPDDETTSRIESGLSANTAAAPQSVSQERSRRAKTPVIDSLRELVRAIYGGEFKRLSLKKAEMAAIRSSANLESSDREGLLELSSADRTLEKTRRLMLLSFECADAIVTGALIKFARDVLHRHPAFATELLQRELEYVPDAPNEIDGVRAVVSQDYGSLLWPEGAAPMTKKEATLCKTNALSCFLLWLRETREISLETIQRSLQVNVWSPVARQYKTEQQKLRTLFTNRDPAATVIACAMHEKKALEQSQQADAARRAETYASARAVELESVLASVEANRLAAQAEVNRLTEKLHESQQAHRDESAQLLDDYERLRGQILRRLKEELSLLDEGLHALRRDPPKVNVMLDHAERAIDGLKIEMERLRGNN